MRKLLEVLLNLSQFRLVEFSKFASQFCGSEVESNGNTANENVMELHPGRRALRALMKIAIGLPPNSLNRLAERAVMFQHLVYLQEPTTEDFGGTSYPPDWEPEPIQWPEGDDLDPIA